MSTRSKSFWSTIPGLITGLAGILTALVGLGTLLIQVGVIGGDGDGDVNTTTRPGATAAPRAGDGSSGSDGSGSGRPTFTVAPDDLKLTLGDKSGEVTVSNTGDTAFTLVAEITGTSADQFTLRRGTCGAEVPENGSCTMTVEFKGLVAATAELELTARGAAASQEVSLEGSLA